jgi:hypothetical protein
MLTAEQSLKIFSFFIRGSGIYAFSVFSSFAYHRMRCSSGEGFESTGCAEDWYPDADWHYHFPDLHLQRRVLSDQ